MTDEPDGVDIRDGHIGEFQQDPNNARKHNPRNVGMIERSLSETGAGRSLLADRNGVLIAGNATIEAAAQAGITEAIVVRTRGDKLVIHQRDDLDAAEPVARKAAIYDNRANELSEWDAEVLANFADLDVLGHAFTDAELDRIFSRSLDEPAGDGDGDGGGAVLGSLEYRVVVDVADERAQAALIEELEARGLRCRPLIS